MSNNIFGEITNIGMNEEISISGIVSLISEIMNSKINVVMENKRIRPESSEVERLYCNNEKILKYTNWQPVYNLRQGIEETIKWFTKNQYLYKSDIYNI